MAIEIPKDLITELQISLRKQANVPSYDPTDPSLPSLPLFHSTGDSPRRRCIHCKARLLRGSDSILCIFCGKHPTEAPPPPIKFQSTSGYRWFLHSLNLDGPVSHCFILIFYLFMLFNRNMMGLIVLVVFWIFILIG